MERGYTFRYGRIPGGKDGITVPAAAIKPEFMRFIWKNNNGKPEWVRDRLLDGDTEVDVTAIYRDYRSRVWNRTVRFVFCSCFTVRVLHRKPMRRCRGSIAMQVSMRSRRLKPYESLGSVTVL